MLTALYGCGKPAAVVDGSAQRIVSLTPGNTEILFALGLDKEIVGVTTYCNYPLQAISKEKIGDFSNPNVEKIIALKPTLILSTDFEQANVSKKLRSFNLNVYDVNPRNLLELYNAIITVGELTGKSKEARALADSIKSKIDSICENVSKKPDRLNPVDRHRDGPALRLVCAVAAHRHTTSTYAHPATAHRHTLAANGDPCAADGHTLAANSDSGAAHGDRRAYSDPDAEQRSPTPVVLPGGL